MIKLTPEQEIAISRYFKGETPNCSTSIDENTLTYGYGELDDYGFWQFQIPSVFLNKGEAKTVSELKRKHSCL